MFLLVGNRRPLLITYHGLKSYHCLSRCNITVSQHCQECYLKTKVWFWGAAYMDKNYRNLLLCLTLVKLTEYWIVWTAHAAANSDMLIKSCTLW